jgi:hypothetical protein
MTRTFGWSKNVPLHQIGNQSCKKLLRGQTNFDQANFDQALTHSLYGVIVPHNTAYQTK